MYLWLTLVIHVFDVYIDNDCIPNDFIYGFCEYCDLNERHSDCCRALHVRRMLLPLMSYIYDPGSDTASCIYANGVV